MTFRAFRIWFRFMVSLLLAAGALADMNTVNCGKCRVAYFGSFAAYSIPLKLTNEISKDEALGREAYYVAFYDESSRVVNVEKYFQGKLFFKHVYFYRADGTLKESRVFNSDGHEAIFHFDENGKRK